MSGVLHSDLRTIRIAASSGLVLACLMVQPASAWQAPPGTSSGVSSHSQNLGGKRERDLLSRPVGDMLQADRIDADFAVRPAGGEGRLSSSDIFLLKIVGALLMVSLVSLIGLKLLFSHGRKARSPIVGPSPTGSGPPDPDGLRWLSGTVRSVTSRGSSSRRNGQSGSDSSDEIAKPSGGTSTSRTKEG